MQCAAAMASGETRASPAFQQAKMSVQRDVRTVVDPREIEEIDRRVAELQLNRRENQPVKQSDRAWMSLSKMEVRVLKKDDTDWSYKATLMKLEPVYVK